MCSGLDAGQVRIGISPVGLLVSSALMAFVNHVVAIVGFSLSGAIALCTTWRILRGPGEL